MNTDIKDMRVEHITERDFQLLRRRSWEWADRRMRWQRFENRVLWPLTIIMGVLAGWELMR